MRFFWLPVALLAIACTKVVAEVQDALTADSLGHRSIDHPSQVVAEPTAIESASPLSTGSLDKHRALGSWRHVAAVHTASGSSETCEQLYEYDTAELAERVFVAETSPTPAPTPPTGSECGVPAPVKQPKFTSAPSDPPSQTAPVLEVVQPPLAGAEDSAASRYQNAVTKQSAETQHAAARPLDVRIREASTIDDLVDLIHSRDPGSLSSKEVLAAAVRLVDLRADWRVKPKEAIHRRIESSLFSLSDSMILNTDSFGPQRLSRVLRLLADLGFDYTGLYHAVGLHVLQHRQEYSAHMLSDVITAFARVKLEFRDTHGDGNLFGAIAEDLVFKASDLDTRALARTAWSFASLGQVQPRLFASMGKQLTRFSHLVHPMDISMAVWAFSTSPGAHNPKLLESLALEIHARVAEFTALEMVSTVHAFDMADFDATELHQLLAKHLANSNLGALTPSALMGTLEVLQQSCPSAPVAFYQAAALHMAQHTDAYTLDSLVELAALLTEAEMGLEAVAILEALAKRALQNITDLRAGQVASLVHSFAVLGVEAPELFTEVAKRVTLHPEQFSPTELTTLVWSYAMMVIYEPAMFNAVADHTVKSRMGFELGDLNNLLSAFASMGIKAPTLYTVVASQAVIHEVEVGEDQRQKDLANRLYNFAADLSRTFK